MSLEFHSKAETLAVLEPVLRNASVLPQIRFTREQWLHLGSALFDDGPKWLESPLIVRSSSAQEDNATQSLAGHFLSMPDVRGLQTLCEAVGKVFDSFRDGSAQDQVFIQPMLSDIAVCGVAFSRDPNNGAPYFVVNYDDRSGSADSVTSGNCNDLAIYYQAKCAKEIAPQPAWLARILSLLMELESLFEHDALDIEFALSREDELFLLQARPLVMRGRFNLSRHCQVLEKIAEKVRILSKPHPYLLGQRSVFGVMPDWNPAEIIGIRPRPLALSLYKELVTDNIWAYQRDNYGYKNLRSFPLLVNFSGQPYIDVRVSFNSFIPSDVDDDLAERLVNYYIERLVETPSHHDKVEFEIIFSCYTLDLPERLHVLRDQGFNDTDCKRLEESLRRLTNNIIHNEAGLWKKDTAKLEELQIRQNTILRSELNTVEKIYWLLEDCKRYGTLPFAGLARAGFIAVQLLRSLVTVEVLSERDYLCFMNALDTVSSRMGRDLYRLSRQAFLEKYGHLRPGTYDILSERYDENPERYFDWVKIEAGGDSETETATESFALSLNALNRLEDVLRSHQLEHNVLSLFNFIKAAIEGREYAKFIFTRSLSEALRLYAELGNQYDFGKDKLSYGNIDIIKRLYASTSDAKDLLERAIKEGKKAYAKTRAVNLPPLITKTDDVFRFELPRNEPNFITLKSVIGRVVDEHAGSALLSGNILLIPNADPGYDWVFSHHPGGFITMYGGANSHMAIRAGELGIPAVIGAGEIFYRQWQAAQVLSVDCANRQVRVLQ